MQLPLIFKATVVPGRGVGRTLGFPTLNFKEASKALGYGVYAGYVDNHQAAFNYGPRATFGIEETLLEAHLLDFSGEWEEAEVQVTITNFIRDIQKFDSVEELKKQIREDIKQAKNFLNAKK